MVKNIPEFIKLFLSIVLLRIFKQVYKGINIRPKRIVYFSFGFTKSHQNFGGKITKVEVC